MGFSALETVVATLECVVSMEINRKHNFRSDPRSSIYYRIMAADTVQNHGKYKNDRFSPHNEGYK
jgi:hypothetical protein